MKSNKSTSAWAVVLLFAFLFASCATTKKAPRKCNGKKGIRTNMGVM